MIDRVQLVTLGCSKNRVDSEHLLRQIDNAKIEIVPEDANLVNSNVHTVLINTCGFIKDAKEESISAILDAVEAKKRGYISKIYVFGCLSQRYQDDLKAEIPEVDGFYGAFSIETVLLALGLNWNSSLNNQRFLTTPSHYAYLKISEGCDRVCSYCAIPLIRGIHKSVPIEDLILEATYLASLGVKELIVVAQDTTYYGLDLYKERKLAYLLEKLSLINGIEWIRLLYSYPASFPKDVLDLMATNPKICKYIDIPLQHINDRVLSNMRRSIDGKGTRELIDSIRSKVPDVALRTTMIVGHPGETDRAFEQLIDFVKEYKFERLGAFTYSPEEGTWGDKNLKDSISKKVKQERFEKLMEVQSAISLEHNLARVGNIERVLVDSLSSDGILVARSIKESPEVDGEILIGSDNLLPKDYYTNLIGKFVNVSIESANEYDLLAKIV